SPSRFCLSGSGGRTEQELAILPLSRHSCEELNGAGHMRKRPHLSESGARIRPASRTLPVGTVPLARRLDHVPRRRSTLILWLRWPPLRLGLLGEAFSDRAFRVRPQLPPLLFCSSPQSSEHRWRPSRHVLRPA